MGDRYFLILELTGIFLNLLPEKNMHFQFKSRKLYDFLKKITVKCKVISRFFLKK